MIKRDSRYDLIKPMYESGKIVSFNDIFKYIPKTFVAKDLGKKVDRFNALMSRVEEFSLVDLFIMAGFFELGEWDILKLIMNEYMKGKNGIPKSIVSSS